MDKTMLRPVDRREGREDSSPALFGWGGPLGIVAGVSTALVALAHPESPQDAGWVAVHLAYFATLVGILLVLVEISARQRGRAGRLGAAGFLVAFVGTALGLLEGREHLFSPDFGQGTPAGLWQLIATALIFSVGYVLLGVAIFRAGVLPRGAGVLLAVSAPVVAFSPPIGVEAVTITANALFGLGLAWVGYGLMRPVAAPRAEVGH